VASCRDRIRSLEAQCEKLHDDAHQLAVYNAELLKLLSEVNEAASFCLEKGMRTYRNGLTSIQTMTNTASEQDAETRQGQPADSDTPQGEGNLSPA